MVVEELRGHASIVWIYSSESNARPAYRPRGAALGELPCPHLPHVKKSLFLLQIQSDVLKDLWVWMAAEQVRTH